MNFDQLQELQHNPQDGATVHATAHILVSFKYSLLKFFLYGIIIIIIINWVVSTLYTYMILTLTALQLQT